MISTGSMAPALLGYHKRVVCPSCRSEFAFGVAYDTDDPAEMRSIELRRGNLVELYELPKGNGGTYVRRGGVRHS